MYGISTRSPALVVDAVVIFKQNDSYPGQLSLAIPPWVGAMSTCQRAVMLCGWGVKAGMVRERVAGKTVWSPIYHRPYLSALGVGSSHNRRYTSVQLLYFAVLCSDATTRLYLSQTTLQIIVWNTTVLYHYVDFSAAGYLAELLI